MVSLFLPDSWRLWLFRTRPAKRAPGDRTDVEIELEMRGNLKELQQYRCKRFYQICSSVDYDQSCPLLEAEAAPRETFQRELMLNEKLAKALIDNKNQYNQNSRAIGEELDSLNQEYWILERNWWSG
ncbi:unnamed protein product [Penicillium salamii]|nr:unnamed protein product [Penicillium salamii]CAG8251588.1 unnamed protein product [Penicillium salamii]